MIETAIVLDYTEVGILMRKTDIKKLITSYIHCIIDCFITVLFSAIKN